MPYEGRPDKLALEFLSKLVFINDEERSVVANHKEMCKAILRHYNLPVPATYELLRPEHPDGVYDFDLTTLPLPFVMKGAMGTEGDAVLLVSERLGKHEYRLVDGKTISDSRIYRLAERIVRGDFSRMGQQLVYRSSYHGGERRKNKKIGDVVIFEEMLKTCPELSPHMLCGLADARVLVYKGAPVHMRLRFATKRTGGRSNLALGNPSPLVGADGITTDKYTVEPQKSPMVSETGTSLFGIQIPEFENVLYVAIEATKALGLTTSAMDISLTDRGPVVLEAHGGVSTWHGIADGRLIVKRILRIEEEGEIPDGVVFTKQFYHSTDEKPWSDEDFKNHPLYNKVLSERE